MALATRQREPSWLRDTGGLLAWVLVSFAASAPGAFFSPGEWYADINKPAWNPPGWVFGPVWTTLYLLMGIAAWRLWRRHGFREARFALGAFLVQLALNAAWTPLFFGLHRMDLAFFEIILLWLAILATLLLFWRRDRWAGLMLVPYLLWVSFASMLNFTLWQLN